MNLFTSIYSFYHVSIYRSIDLSIHPGQAVGCPGKNVHLSIYLTIYLSIYLSIWDKTHDTMNQTRVDELIHAFHLILDLRLDDLYAWHQSDQAG